MRIPTAVALLLLAVPATSTAKQGDVSSAKTLAVQKLTAVRVSGLRDLVFPPSVEVPAAQETEVCIFSSDAGHYSVLARGSAGDSFLLRSPRRQIPYSVSWFDTPQGGAAVALTAGEPSPLFHNADRESDSCSGATNARLRIALDPAAFAQVPPSVYTDTLTLLVSPY
jgi:hypothetical protein